MGGPELKIGALLKQKQCTVRQFMSLLGLLTATEKQVPFRLPTHEAYLELACPRVLRKVYPCSKVSTQTPKVEEDNVPVSQPPHHLQYAHQVCLSTNSPDSECHKQDSQKRLSEDNSHSSWLAQHVVVLGSSEPVIPAPVCLPYQPNLLTQLFNGNLYRDLLNLNLHAWLPEL